MKLIPLGSAWVNPEHVVTVTEIQHSPDPVKAVVITLVSGPTLTIHGAIIEEVVRLLQKYPTPQQHTEEPPPDPLPYVFQGRRFEKRDQYGDRAFSPRPEYSQKRSDYR